MKDNDQKYIKFVYYYNNDADDHHDEDDDILIYFNHRLKIVKTNLFFCSSQSNKYSVSINTKKMHIIYHFIPKQKQK